MPHVLRGHDIRMVTNHEGGQSGDKAQDGYDVAHNDDGDDISDDL